MSRFRRQTELFSQLVNGKHFYRQRTGHEQALADCFDDDNNFFQDKANVWSGTIFRKTTDTVECSWLKKSTWAETQHRFSTRFQVTQHKEETDDKE